MARPRVPSHLRACPCLGLQRNFLTEVRGSNDQILIVMDDGSDAIQRYLGKKALEVQVWVSSGGADPVPADVTAWTPVQNEPGTRGILITLEDALEVDDAYVAIATFPGQEWTPFVGPGYRGE